MTDVILVQNGIAWQIWRSTTILALVSYFHPILVAAMVQAPANTVNELYTYDGTAFHAPA